MQSKDSSASDPHSAKGLPPVTPPSGKFIAQLFLVPLAIVGAIALVFFAILWLFGDVLGGLGGPRRPAQFLDKLDKSNPDVRWRGAADLAQVLLRDNQLASDPRFALDLAERLRKAMDATAAGEKALAERLAKQPRLAERLSKLVQGEPDLERAPDDAEWKALKAQWTALEPDLNYTLYLSACLGNFALPVGAPLLIELAGREPAEDNILVTMQRRRAVWALANLGDNLRRFDRLSPERQAEVLDRLEREAAVSGDRGRWARAALDFLTARQAGRPQTMGVDEVLVRCAEDPQDPFLRELAAFAMGFWEGTPDENRRMEQALFRLTQDDGRGSELLAHLWVNRENIAADSQPVTSRPGVRVQYNANLALARRGSDRVRLDMLEEMLDEEGQKAVHRLRRSDGREDPDEATAYLTVVGALKGLTELHAKNPTKVAERPSLREAIDRLAQSRNAIVRTEAEQTRIALSPSP
ncbi:MAG TPA: hypothetical protein VNK04_25035 [Gemmataceae bacterium]|nr:hypothetical protein [Gemmataceae bacterium]